MTQINTYPDGSQRHGEPPFPEISPKQEEALKLHGIQPVIDKPEPEPEKPKRGRPPASKAE